MSRRERHERRSRTNEKRARRERAARQKAETLARQAFGEEKTLERYPLVVEPFWRAFCMLRWLWLRLQMRMARPSAVAWECWHGVVKDVVVAEDSTNESGVLSSYLASDAMDIPGLYKQYVHHRNQLIHITLEDGRRCDVLYTLAGSISPGDGSDWFLALKGEPVRIAGYLKNGVFSAMAVRSGDALRYAAGRPGLTARRASIADAVQARPAPLVELAVWVFLGIACPVLVMGLFQAPGARLEGFLFSLFLVAMMILGPVVVATLHVLLVQPIILRVQGPLEAARVIWRDRKGQGSAPDRFRSYDAYHRAAWIRDRMEAPWTAEDIVSSQEAGNASEASPDRDQIEKRGA